MTTFLRNYGIRCKNCLLFAVSKECCDGGGERTCSVYLFSCVFFFLCVFTSKITTLNFKSTHSDRGVYMCCVF